LFENLVVQERQRFIKYLIKLSIEVNYDIIRHDPPANTFYIFTTTSIKN